MAERFYIQWNIVNWVTIVAMVFFGTLIIGAISSAVRQYAGGVSDDV